MKSYSTQSGTPVRRDLTDRRSSRTPTVPPTRKTLLHDRRSTS